MSFKLLAIKPLQGCDRIFLKNLKEDETYKFYQNFIYPDNFDNEKHLDIYSNDKININISAVVGENGSGKSSLIDFFNAINYYLSCYHFKTMSPTDYTLEIQIRSLFAFSKEFINEMKDELNEESFLYPISEYFINDFSELDYKEIAQELLNYLGNLIKKKENIFIDREKATIKINKLEDESIYYLYEYISDSNCIEEKFWKLIDLIKEKLNYLPEKLYQEKEYNNKIKNYFNFELYYQNNNKIEKIKKSGDKVTLTDESFFYSILLNYSLHSLNATVMGEWIHSLFHKNDGYQTPIVINPYRENGVIDINKEKKLSIDRLFYNLLEQLNSDKNATLLKKYTFNKLILKLKFYNREPSKEIDSVISDKHSFLVFLSNHIHTVIYDSNKNILDYVFGYIFIKFRKISGTYMTHFYDLDYSEVQDNDDWKNKRAVDYINENEKSHVTRKFYQSYNFLKNYEKYSNKLDFINQWNLDEEIELTKENLTEWIELIKNEILKGQDEIITEDILVHLFPAIFDIDIEFLIDGKTVKLSDMSSGEQQYIFNISTIVYHINNLKTIKEKEGTKIKSYKNVNIILDEVELYYHPQFQKNLVNDITKSIQEIQGLGELTNFNILFLTHSPFILSDIPNDNVLKLKAGIPENSINEKTFGANIHDLLHNDFFLQDGFMGEFAKEKIEDVIFQLNAMDLIQQIKVLEKPYQGEIETNKINLIKKELDLLVKGTEFNKLELYQIELSIHSNKAKLLNIIDIIGEPVYRYKLKEMYNKVFPEESKKSTIEEIQRLLAKNGLTKEDLN